MNLYTTATMRAAAACPMRGAVDPVPAGHCWWCGYDLPARRLRWCSSECLRTYQDNHEWQSASFTARARDEQRCTRCGKGAEDAGNIKARYPGWYGDGRDRIDYWPLEVNHIDPRRGGGYEPGCWHHLDGLETLCHTCHVAETTRQLRDWKYVTSPLPLGKSGLLDLGAEQIHLGWFVSD